MPEKLGPYRLVRLLGQGGMGSVYLANQTSLDRDVALKVVRTKLAGNPAMLARFTREAYAAAQLVHPNVVQIYDMGDDAGNCYFSMELVNGSSLIDLVKHNQKIDPELATSYILHAARGLQCAHNAGMVHRDIKPANLLVNEAGVVKVADLGLVKVPDQEEIQDEVDELSAISASQDLTRVGSLLGTPYYMAPEQAKSSISVDHRADIYSLGCTFYVLLTGKRPFEGDTVEELVSKHTSAPLVIPSKIVDRVPAELSAIVSRMMEKKPEDRYQDMGELIVDLERHLGIASATAFTPDEQDADTIERSAKEFLGSPLVNLRRLLPLATIAGSLMLTLVMLFVSWRWATGFALLPLAALASHFLISGVREDSILFSQFRELVFRSGVANWIKWFAAVLLLVVSSFLVGTFFPWLVLTLVGAGLGVAFYFAIDKPIATTHQQGLARAKPLLQKMRIKGMNEETIQMFVAKYSGDHWEEFFEKLFGYPAKRRVRDTISQSDIGKKKPKFRAWRDGIYDGLNRRLETINQAEDQQHLQKVEQAGLVAQGVSAADAKEQATQMAAAIVDHGESVRVAALEKLLEKHDPKRARLQQRLKIKSLLADARSGKYAKKQTTLQRLTPVLDRFFGSYPRFLLGCCLIIGCLMWARQNELFSVDQLKESAIQATQALTTEGTEGIANQASEQLASIQESLAVTTQPLAFPIVGGLFDNFNSLIAGLLLIGSVIVFGWRMSVFMLPAVAIVLWGDLFGIPALIPVPHVHALSALIGVGLFVLGVVFGRSEA